MIISMGLITCDVLIAPVDPSVFDRDSTHLESLDILPGGDALNAAVSLAKYGDETALVGAVGNDAFGKMIEETLAQRGVNTEYLFKNPEAATATSVVMISQGGDRRFAYYGACNDSLTDGHLPGELLSRASHLHLGSAMALSALEGESLKRLMKRAKDAGLTTSMDVTHDARDRWLPVIEDALPYVDIFMPSHYEAEKICGLKDPKRIAAFFFSRGVKVFCLKMGEKGAYAADKNGGFFLPPLCGGPVVDTTGAGDAFCAGFLSARLGGADLFDSALFASAASALCIQEVGATQGIWTKEETRCYALRRKKELGL